jgi:hypothetical protein
MTTPPAPPRLHKLQSKMHGMAVGMTLGIGSMYLGQGCPLLGQCPTCAACASRLPLIFLPLVADGVISLAALVMQRKAAKSKDDSFIQDQPESM